MKKKPKPKPKVCKVCGLPYDFRLRPGTGCSDWNVLRVKCNVCGGYCP